MSGDHDSARLTLVVNPTAGSGRTGRLLPLVTAKLVAGLPADSLRVERAASWQEARRLCADVVANARETRAEGRSDSLLVMGGDGMMHLGLNAVAGTDVPLGLIPSGRGNDFCRGVEVPTHWSPAVQTIIAGQTRRIDLMAVTGALVDGARHRWVGSIVSTGFDARVNYRTNHQKLRLGQLSYGFAALAELSRFEPLNYRLTIDGVPRVQPAMFIAVGNAGWFGGGMHGCPQADVSDGLLDITVINPVSRLTLLRLLPTMYSGGFVKDPAVELLRASRVEVDGDDLFAMADGEELGPVPLTLRAVPDALTVYVPAPR